MDPLTLVEAKEQYSDTGKVILAIKNKLYDVTNFLDEHPGGSDILKEANFKDCTDEYVSIGHSTTAEKQLSTLYLCDLKDCDANMTNYIKDDRSKQITGVYQIMTTLGIFGLLLIIFLITRYFLS